MMRDPYWKSFLQFVVRNKLWVSISDDSTFVIKFLSRYAGPELAIEEDGSYISRLE